MRSPVSSASSKASKRRRVRGNRNCYPHASATTASAGSTTSVARAASSGAGCAWVPATAGRYGRHRSCCCHVVSWPSGRRRHPQRTTSSRCRRVRRPLPMPCAMKARCSSTNSRRPHACYAPSSKMRSVNWSPRAAPRPIASPDCARSCFPPPNETATATGARGGTCSVASRTPAAGHWRGGRANSATTRMDSEHIARTLLRRYGVVSWRILEREAAWLPAWRELRRVYHRLEARGEIRGGRFVDGLVGEQFALPEALAALRQIRHRAHDGEIVCIAGTDPLNLVGSMVAGGKVPSTIGNRIAIRDGVPLAAMIAGKFVTHAIGRRRPAPHCSESRQRTVPPAIFLGNQLWWKPALVGADLVGDPAARREHHRRQVGSQRPLPSCRILPAISGVARLPTPIAWGRVCR